MSILLSWSFDVWKWNGPRIVQTDVVCVSYYACFHFKLTSYISEEGQWFGGEIGNAEGKGG